MPAVQVDREGPSGTLAAADSSAPRSVETRHPRLRAAIDLSPNGSTGWTDVISQLLLIGCAAGLYFLVRDLTKDQAALAFKNAEALVRFETSLGLNLEAAAQAMILDHDWVIAFFNWVYIYGHWPVIAATLIYTFMKSRREYLMFRDAIIFSGAIGLFFFVLYPVAPPRLADPSSFFDSLELSSAYKVLQPQGIVNRYAALPSFHVGWNLLAAIALWNASGLRRFRPLSIAMPILMTLAVVLTANHWLIDVVAGAAIAITGCIAARRLRNRRAATATTR